VLGLVALGAAWLPAYLDTRPISLPIVLIGAGALLFALPSPLQPPDPREHLEVTEHLTELGVLVALIGSGLSIDRPIGLRRWANTWRLLAIALPLGVVATALTGWWLLGLAPASAVLLGAALAPTDPVLASDVQVGEPSVAQEPDDEIDEVEPEDEVRVTLTSEAGLNDGLAFPFVYAAIAMAAAGSGSAAWIGEWLAVDVLYKLAAGLVLGLLTGRLLGRLFFRARPEPLRLAKHSEGFVALATTFLAYGVTEVAGGYGFLAVFVCACSIRASERTHEYHSVLHDFAEQIERLLTVLLLLLFGGAIVSGLLAPLTWQGAAAGLVLLLVIRPAGAWLSLLGSPGRPGEKVVIAIFGIRGIGSFYYLAYALSEAEFPGEREVWAITGLVVVVSVFGHGIAATPVMRHLDRARKREG
jgi:NhaP-type Na+/H+ or K+/H+ antiporter